MPYRIFQDHMLEELTARHPVEKEFSDYYSLLVDLDTDVREISVRFQNCYESAAMEIYLSAILMSSAWNRKWMGVDIKYLENVDASISLSRCELDYLVDEDYTYSGNPFDENWARSLFKVRDTGVLRFVSHDDAVYGMPTARYIDELKSILDADYLRNPPPIGFSRLNYLHDLGLMPRTAPKWMDGITTISSMN